MKMLPLFTLFSELRELVKLHGESHMEHPVSEEEEEPLSYDEVLIIKVWHYVPVCFKQSSNCPFSAEYECYLCRPFTM